MNLQARKLSLIEWLASVDDEQVIDKIEHLQKRKTSKGELKPLSLKSYHKMIDESEQDISQGRVYAHEDVVKYMKRKR
jgi:hypothetical protein